LRIAVIGGSGLYRLSALKLQGEQAMDTPFGAVSALMQKYVLASANGGELEVFFLPRHGREHSIAPHQINYRANIYALAELQVDSIIAINAVGGVHASQAPGLLVVPDQLIDYSYGREHSFANTVAASEMHVDFSFPYSEGLRERLLAAAAANGYESSNGGVYACTQGPRLETAAEIRRLAADGCDIVGMTGMPEAALARELGIAYACLALVVNPAAGVVSREISMADMQQCMADGMGRIEQLLLSLFQTHQ
jgi:5'-methylthioinosine phosphorylase